MFYDKEISEVEITTNCGITNQGVPYKELRATIEFGLDISIRKYPRRTFLAFEDDRDNPSGGADLLDCYLTPTYIFSKTPNENFSVEAQLPPLLEKINGYINDDDLSKIAHAWQSLRHTNHK